MFLGEDLSVFITAETETVVFQLSQSPRVCVWL